GRRGPRRCAPTVVPLAATRAMRPSLARTPLALLAHGAGSRASPVLSSVGGGEALFGGSGSNGDSRLQRPLSCHWTTPDRHPPEHGPGLRRAQATHRPPPTFGPAATSGLASPAPWAL